MKNLLLNRCNIPENTVLIDTRIKSHLTLCAVVCLALNLSTVAEAIDFPKQVDIKNQRQSFSTENEYALRDGRIWIRPNCKLTKTFARWELFQGTGVPSGKRIRSFNPGDSVVAFGTEGLMVVALSNRGRIYYWQSTLPEPVYWTEEMGSPFKDSLFMPPHRDWTFSLSVRPHKTDIRTPMRDIDTYYDDCFGEHIQFGLTATVYVLDPDGQKIRFVDTGLPSSFHKAFTTPERGRFVAERVVASGSVVFVIDRSGKMYTILYDYEVSGACPAQDFTYTPSEQKGVPREDGNLVVMKAKRGLPLRPWKLQTAIPESGKAEITTNITITMTGKGTLARELRVQGRNSNGEPGYYFKDISADSWSFRVTGDAYDDSTIIARNAAHVQGDPLDRDYSGIISQAFSDDLKAELVGFYCYGTSSILRVILPSGKKIDLDLYLFDAWSMTEQMKDNIAYVGSVQGEPKLLHATLSIPDKLLHSTDPEIKMAIDMYFKRFHHVHAAFYVSADDESVEMSTQWVQRNSFGYCDYRFRKGLHLRFSRTLTESERLKIVDNGLAWLANSKELMLEGCLVGRNISDDEIFKLIARNEAMMDELKKINRNYKIDHMRQGLMNTGALMAFYPIALVVNIFNLGAINDDLAGGMLTGSQSLIEYSGMNLKLTFKDLGDYDKAMLTLKERIDGLKQLLVQGKDNYN